MYILISTKTFFISVFLVMLGTLASCTTLPPTMQKPGTSTQLSAAQIAAVHEGIKIRLKDPGSAIFPGETFAAVAADGEITACGLVNAKNSFGGYTGASLYIAIMREKTVIDATVEDSDYGIVQSFCRQRGVAI